MASEKPKFQHLPAECTCNGEMLILVRRESRIGGLRELRTYRCPKCGHVETLEALPSGLD